MDVRSHWDRVYGTKTDQQVSWFEASPSTSLELIDAAGAAIDGCVIDIGGGNSRLIDALLASGMRCLTVLDVSGIALDAARVRLGSAADVVRWIEADVTAEWSAAPVDIWHDRAVFHFLTDAVDLASPKRRRYHRLHVPTAGAASAVPGMRQC